MDIDDIPLGEDFRMHLATEAQQCDVLLAVIGDTGWMRLTGRAEERHAAAG